MTKADRHESRSAMLAEFQDRCRREGLPLTAQRRAIFEALAARSDHPSAEDVFAEARRRLPELSRATVYRTLETFAKRGLVRLAHHAGPVARFDGRVDQHHHLLCRHCGAIADLGSADLHGVPLPDARSVGFQIETYSIQFEGTCSSCKRRQAERPAPAPTRRRAHHVN